MKNYRTIQEWENEKDNLIDYLVIKKLSLTEVGRLYNTSKDTIKKICLNLEIDISSHLRGNNINWKKEDLEHLLFVERKTTSEIAEIYGVSNHSVVLRAIKRLGISTENLPTIFLKIDKNQLLDLVFNQKLSIEDLSKYYDTSITNIRNILRKNGIVKLPSGQYYSEDYKLPNYNSDGSIKSNYLPVPLKYTYLDNLVIKVRRGKYNDSVKYYYIPELGRFIRSSQLNKRLKLLGIDKFYWINKWIGRAIDPFNLDNDSIDRLLNVFYKDKPYNTKQYIKEQLLSNYKYECDFYILKEDFIDEFLSSNKYINLLKEYIDFSSVPDKISTVTTKVTVRINNSNSITISIDDLRRIPTNTFSRIFKDLNVDERIYLPRNNYTYGELFIKNWLDLNKFTYKDNNQYINIGNRVVRPDFIVNKGNCEIWIEYNGKQHYKYIEFIQKDISRFQQQLDRDNDVRTFCKKDNIILIEIPYILDSYQKVSNFLDKTIIQKVDPETIIDYKNLYK